MNIKDMNLAQVIARLASLDEEVRSMTDPDKVNEAAELKRQLLERKAELLAAEMRAAGAAAIANGTANPTVVERGQASVSTVEMKDTEQYKRAFLKAFKTGNETELRALLTDQVSGGTVPVPTFLENEIKNAWEESQLMNLVKKTNYAGNVKIGFEYSATGASVHVEGTEAPAEEQLVWGSVELKPQNIKKWITVSDEAIEGTTIDTLNEIYKEVAQRIVEAAEEMIIAKIIASPAQSTTTAPAVPTYSAATVDVETITMALAELSGKAKNVTLVMNRRTYATFKAAAKKAHYGQDPFDGCAVVFTDALDAFSTADSGETYVIAGDFGYGFQANFPNGNEVKMKLDDLSLAERDLVKIVGRQYVGLGVVAPKAFVKIIK